MAVYKNKAYTFSMYSMTTVVSLLLNLGNIQNTMIHYE